jgi:hypothetical protein
MTRGAVAFVLTGFEIVRGPIDEKGGVPGRKSMGSAEGRLRSGSVVRAP